MASAGKGSVRPSQPLNTTTANIMEAAGRGSMMAGRRQVKNGNTGGSPEECPVCLTGYDGTVQRPRTLPCGHTVCMLCIDQLEEQGRVACPECRVSHAVPEGGQFPVNYSVEAFIRMLRDAEVAAAAAALPPPSAGEGEGAAAGATGKKEAVGLSKKMRSFLQEQEATVLAAITACREAQSQLDQYQTTLAGWRERQQQLEDRLLGLVDQSRSARELLQQEESRAAAKEEELKKEEQGLQAVLEMLHTLTTEQEVGVVVSEVFRCTGEAEQTVEECRECFPDANTVTTVRKVRETSSSVLEAAQAIHSALKTVYTIIAEDPILQSDPDFTVIDKLHFFSAPNLTAEDLHSLTQPAKHLLEAGRVFAVHQAEGQYRHARISLEAGQLYLHALKDHPPPWGMATLQVSEIVPPSPPCTVFLDLSWPGSAPRRVRIHLSPDTPRGRQFLLLCTGQHGPSYVNTMFNQLIKIEQLGEYVVSGRFVGNDGHWTSVLLPGLDEGDYRESCRSGDVFGVVWRDFTGDECGYFGICTRGNRTSLKMPRVFGEVVDGLHVVAEAVQHRDIDEVTVADCGLVL